MFLFGVYGHGFWSGSKNDSSWTLKWFPNRAYSILSDDVNELVLVGKCTVTWLLFGSS